MIVKRCDIEFAGDRWEVELHRYPNTFEIIIITPYSYYFSCTTENADNAHKLFEKACNLVKDGKFLELLIEKKLMGEDIDVEINSYKASSKIRMEKVILDDL